MEKGVQTNVLKGLDLEINSGEIVSVVGPSGAGKSTLLHIIGLMDSPTEGKLLLDEKDYSLERESVRSGMRSSKIGFLFQMHYLLPEFNVLENVLLPAWDKRNEARVSALGMLETMGLSDRLTHMPNELSGGEQQRVALVRSLINEPECLLCDEPTGNLDRETGEKVEKLIFEEAKKRKITAIIVTHNPDLARKTDRTISIRDGLLV
jgi:lipoprotein-releasing system ATP-binding protein